MSDSYITQSAKRAVWTIARCTKCAANLRGRGIPKSLIDKWIRVHQEDQPHHTIEVTHR